MNRVIQPISLQALPANAFTISHSSHQLYLSCRRKFEFRKFYKSTRDEDGLAAGVGKAIHAAWQHWMQFQNEELAVLELMKNYPFEAYWRTEKNADKRSLESAYATLMSMMGSVTLDEYEIVQIKCLDGEIRPAIEVPFAIEIEGFSLNGKFNPDGSPEIPVFYIGFVDAFLFHSRNGDYKTTDVKTTRDWTKDLTPKYMYSDQCVPYGLVLEHMLGHPISGFEVVYINAFVDLIEPEIKIYPFQKSLEEVEDWYSKLLVDLHQISNFYQAGWFPRDGGDGCLSYGQPCKFLDPCKFRDKEAIQAYLLQDEEPKPEEPFVPWIRFKLAMR